jgi:hypothetical protein
MAKTLSLASTNQAANSEEASSSLHEISSAFESIANSISSETKDIFEIGKVFKNITSSNQKVFDIIQKLAEIAKKSNQDAEKSKDTISVANSSMDEIKNLGVPGLSTSYINLHLLPVFQNKIAIGDKGFPWTYIDSRNDISYAKGICPVAENLQDETYFSFYINDYSLGKKQIKFIYDSFARVIDKFIRNNN